MYLVWEKSRWWRKTKKAIESDESATDEDERKEIGDSVSMAIWWRAVSIDLYSRPCCSIKKKISMKKL